MIIIYDLLDGYLNVGILEILMSLFMFKIQFKEKREGKTSSRGRKKHIGIKGLFSIVPE